MSTPNMNGIEGAIQPTGHRKNLVPFSSRLKGGRALGQDVWSIYKCGIQSTSALLYLINKSSVQRISLTTVLIWAKDT